jgi:hypothetical protein
MGLLMSPEGVLAGVPGATATQGCPQDAMLPVAAVVLPACVMLVPAGLLMAVVLGVVRGVCS